MAPARTPSTRRARSRTGSPYTGRPEGQSNAVARREDARAATPKSQQQEQKQGSSHRYGLRSMLSNLIWGSPVKRVEETEEEPAAADDQHDGKDREEEASVSGDEQAVQVISDDEDPEPSMPSLSNSQYDPSRYEPPQRLSAAQKGKGRAQGDGDQQSFNGQYTVIPKRMTGGLRSSQILGDLRSIQNDLDASMDVATSTPNAARTQTTDTQSPAEINSQLASFFAAKGTATLTADERKRISEILLGGGGSSQPASDVPTALTPNFSFSVPLPSAASPNVSIISPAYRGLQRSSTTVRNLSGLATKPPGGLTGSQSLSSLSTLAAAADGNAAPSSAASNPRSALNRRQARPLYLGAGYSSQAIARRRRMQAQMSSLYGSLDSFDSTGAEASAATPGKRRRVGEDASTSTAVPTSQTNSSQRVYSSTNAPPPFSATPATPVGASARPLRPAQTGPLFNQLGTQPASLPTKPSPLAQTSNAAAPSPPGTPADRHEQTAPASQPRAMSKTAGLMRGILGDTSEPTSRTPLKASSQAASTSTPSTLSISRTHEEPTRVPREKLIKRTQQPSAAEILERTAPPEVRTGANGKQSRPKPPPVPGSARKTRAAQAAQEKEERDKKQKAAEEAKQSLRPPARTRSKSKTPTETSPQPSQQGPSPAESSQSASRQPIPAQPQQDSERRSREASSIGDSPAPGPAPTAAPKAAFEFKSPAATTPAPTLFAKEVAKPPTQPVSAPSTQSESSKKPMFSFAPPPAQERITSPALSSTTATPSAAASAPASRVSKEEAVPTREPVFNQAAKAAASGDEDKRAKEAALAIPTVSLPTFTLYDFGFSFSQPQIGGEADDPKTRAVKQTVLEIPASELPFFNLL